MPTRLAAVLVAALCLATGASAVSGTGTIYTFAGTGAAGFGGDGGRATAAQLNAPSGLAVDGAGNLYIADRGNHRIRKVTPAGVISTIAGTTTGGFSGDGGPATSAQLFGPRGVALDGAGNLYVADTGNNRIRRIATNGTITTVAGNGVEDQTEDGVPATQAALNEPSAVAADSAGTVYIAESDRVVKVGADGMIRTVAGAVYSSGYNGDGIPGAAATLDSPTAVALDAAGNVYISDTDNQRVRRVGTDGIIRTIAGTGGYGFSGEGGPATAAQINGPYGLAIGADGSVYLADQGNHRVRKILANGTFITVAGGGTSKGQFVAAVKAELGDLYGTAVDRAGNLFVADTSTNRVFRVSDLTAELGTVSRAWVSTTRNGSAARRVSSETREIWVHFVFAELPAAGLPIVVDVFSPRRKLASLQKTRAARIDVVVRRQRNAVFGLGRWRAVLRVANKPVRTVTFEVRPFSTK